MNGSEKVREELSQIYISKLRELFCLQPIFFAEICGDNSPWICSLIRMYLSDVSVVKVKVIISWQECGRPMI